jgi:hypothetical protein
MAVVTGRLSGLNSSSAFKGPCRVATTGNITLSGIQAVDGVTPVSTESERRRRILVWQQTLASENGIYVMSPGTWSRAKDMDDLPDFVKGTRVLVASGSTGFGVYVVTSDVTDAFVLNTDSISFASATATDLGITLPTVDNSVPRFDGVAGMMQTSGVTIDDSDGLAVPGDLAVSGQSLQHHIALFAQVFL